MENHPMDAEELKKLKPYRVQLVESRKFVCERIVLARSEDEAYTAAEANRWADPITLIQDCADEEQTGDDADIGVEEVEELTYEDVAEFVETADLGIVANGIAQWVELNRPATAETPADDDQDDDEQKTREAIDVDAGYALRQLRNAATATDPLNVADAIRRAMDAIERLRHRNNPTGAQDDA